MTLPDDLPGMIEYKVGTMTLTTLPRRPVQSVGTSGDTDADIVRPMIPYGCTGWRLPQEPDWNPLSSIPAHWMPFLNRKRPSEIDMRDSLETCWAKALRTPRNKGGLA